MDDVEQSAPNRFEKVVATAYEPARQLERQGEKIISSSWLALQAGIPTLDFFTSWFSPSDFSSV
jgi:hypothetical protein